MSDRTKIEWADATWNPITGCSVLSPGCTNCYAMGLAGTRLAHHPSRAGLTRETKAGPVWTGEVRFNEQWLTQPLKWKRPRMVFVCAHGDLFHESVPDAWIDRVFAVMALCHQHVLQVLTKRSARMRRYLSDPTTPSRIARVIVDMWIAGTINPKSWGERWPVKSVGDVDDPDDLALAAWPLPNVWAGISAEDQRRADERIPDLLATPAAVRWVSAEPMLGWTDYRKWLPGSYECAEECGWRSGSAPLEEVCQSCGWTGTNAGEFCARCGHQDFGHVCPQCDANAVHQHPDTPNLDWIVVGGESGLGARPMHPQWARDIRDQCVAAGVPFFPQTVGRVDLR